MRLPIHDVLPDVIATLRDHDAVVLHAPTGAGKTTVLPAALLDAGLAGDGQIWVLEPRRLAARATARHVAATRPRDQVGWHVRFEPRFTDRTRLLYMTDGIAVRRLQADPFLEGVSIVVFDEFHERALATDLALAMVRRVQREVRDDLKIVVMSATLDATRVASFLDDAPVVRSAGRAYPVEVRWLARPDERHPTQVCADGVRRALAEADGDVLAFLPGVGEIEGTRNLLDLPDVDVVPLYGALPPAAQDRAIRPGPRRRVVLATNVAETSLTIEGIGAVVDTGLARVLRHDPGSGLDRLQREPISKAAADQRKGRAGRLGPGVCFRLWTERGHVSRPDHDTPALQRTDLAGALLQLRAWGEPDPRAFPWVEAPPAHALDAGDALLRALHLLDDSGLTALGRAAAALPVHPRLAVLALTAAHLGHPDAGCLAAAVLSERDPFHRHDPTRDRATASTDSDVLDRVYAVRDGRDPRLRPGARDAVRKVADQLRKQLGRVDVDTAATALPDTPRPSPTRAPADTAVLRGLAAGWADRIALRREPHGRTARLMGGRGVVQSPQSGVREARLFAVVQADDGGGVEANVRMASAVDEAWLPVEERVDVQFDPVRRQVTARRVLAVADLILAEHTHKLPDAHRFEACLVDALRDDPTLLPLDHEAVDALRARLAVLHQHCPELDLPVLDASFIDAALPAIAAGRRGIDTLTGEALATILFEQLPWAARQTVDREAPERLEVPSGSRIRLLWRSGHRPALAVRIQEIFGWHETPRLAKGRAPVVLHLLAPNQRPTQVTDDLHSFWSTTWVEVRKDLRARYPKHSWPEDPWTAQAEKRPRRKR